MPGRAGLPGGRLAILLLACGVTSDVSANLADTLHDFVETHGALVEDGVFDTLTPVLERLADQGTDLPPNATSLGFSYRYDPESGAMSREERPLGSIYLDRPPTLGRHVVALGLLYEHVALTQYEGDDLAEQITLRSRIAFGDGSTLTRYLRFTELKVASDLLKLFATVGITDTWDASVLLPIAVTRLDVAARQTTVARSPGAPDERTVDTPSASDEAAGVGDLLLRSKWHLTTTPLDLGVVLGVRAPTGSTEDFRGLGDWLVEPDVLLAREFGRNEVHAMLGVAFNAGDLAGTRARYGAGGSVQPWTGLAFFADVLGSSAFKEQEFEVRSPSDAFVESAFLDQFIVSGPRRLLTGSAVTERIPRTDVIDLSVGVKWNPVPSGFVFAGALVPLTDDGFRPVVVPTFGGQWVF